MSDTSAPGGPGMFRRSCIVVAHPDDEILWFSSVIKRVDRIIICFLGNARVPDRAAARQRVLDQFPLKTVKCLGWDVPLTRQYSKGEDPVETEFGLQMPVPVQKAYEASFAAVRNGLAHELRGYDNIFTHNPWGEYGHEMHVQVHRAIEHICGNQGSDLWFSNYVSARSMPLAERRILGARDAPICLETDRGLAERIRDLYIREGCWTASVGHEWPERECFNRLPGKAPANSEARPFFQLNKL